MKKYLLLLIASGFILGGCSKTNSDLFIPYAGNPANDTSWAVNVNTENAAFTLFEGLSYAPYIDSFNVTGSALLHVNNDLDVAIPAASLTYADGSMVTPGKVRVEIRHLNRRGDFIRYARPTTSYGKIMESVGVIQIRFFRQDQKLLLQQGKKLFITIKDPNPVNNTTVFFGSFSLQPPLPYGTNPFFTWTTAMDSSFATPFIHQDSTGVIKGYQMFAGNADWINAQYPVDQLLTKTNINVTLPANFTNQNTAMFAVVKQRKVVVQLNGDYSTRTFAAPNIPVGNTIILVSLSKIGNQYYLGFKETDASQNLIAIVNPVAKSQLEISQFLSSL